MKAIIRLSRERLLYDISNNAYVVGESMPDDDRHRRHLVQDITQDQNRDRVDRVLWLAFCRTAHLFGRMLTAPPSPHHAPSCGDYVLSLQMAPAVPQSTIDYWAVLAYEMMTAAALADWLDVVAPDKALVWHQRANDTSRLLATSIATAGGARKRMEVI